MSKLKQSCFLLFLLVTANSVSANSQWFVRPILGLSQMTNLQPSANAIDNASGESQVDLSQGFLGGIGLGYYLNPNLALEMSREYRSNEAETLIANQAVFNDGNYASNLFFVNALYFFQSTKGWEPYLGTGLSWAEEIDIDLERDGMERSYSTNGQVGWQLFTGANYKFNSNWAVNLEARLGQISDIKLTGESSDGTLEGMDYHTSTLQLGLTYHL